MSDPAELARLPVGSAPPSLVDVAYLTLREAITSGSLAPGTRLRELALARRLAISTTPIREALRKLDREGLVQLSPNRGAIVAEFTLREIIDLFEVREVLECRAIRRAASQPARELQAIEPIIAAATELVPFPERIEWNRLEIGFHRSINDIGGNVELADLAERTHRQVQALCVRALRDPIYGPESRQLMQTHHLAIVAAVRDGRADEAETLTRTHIRVIRDSIVDVLGSEAGDGRATSVPDGAWLG